MIINKNVTGAAALTYIKDQLSNGGVLSTCINRLPLGNGKICALVPENTSDKNLFNFKYGVLYPFDKNLIKENHYSMPIQNEARPVVVEMIHQFLNANDVNCCLFEDPISKPMDPIVTKSPIDYICLKGGEMFYFFNLFNNDSSVISKALLRSENYNFLCALSSVDISLQSEFSPNKEVSLNLIEKFAGGVSAFFVKAYDYEGYLMWVRN